MRLLEELEGLGLDHQNEFPVIGVVWRECLGDLAAQKQRLLVLVELHVGDAAEEQALLGQFVRGGIQTTERGQVRLPITQLRNKREEIVRAQVRLSQDVEIFISLAMLERLVPLTARRLENFRTDVVNGLARE